MANDKSLGAVTLLGSVLGIILYGALLYYFPMALLELTAFVAVVVLLGILAWIGWTMATTPPPEPMPEVPQASSSAGSMPPAPGPATGTSDAAKKS